MTERARDAVLCAAILDQPVGTDNAVEPAVDRGGQREMSA